MVVEIEAWEQRFQELMQQEKPWDKWTLSLDENVNPNCLDRGWRQHRQRAFGRFQCSSCWRSWASAQVQILCHMHWDPYSSRGQVRMRLFAQRCQKCYSSLFEKPEFSPESVTQILNNLVQRILECYYRDGLQKFPRMPVKVEVPLDGPHDSANCEACTLGICVQGFQSHMIAPSKSLLPTKAKETPRIGCNFVQKWSGPDHLERNHGGSSSRVSRGLPLITIPSKGFRGTGGSCAGSVSSGSWSQDNDFVFSGVTGRGGNGLSFFDCVGIGFALVICTLRLMGFFQ
ncbi:receptor-transporting protein 4 [Lepus europaeus]|uniref:receptor-transporting protein 4 n=1 Tax=Lepus europaeus TaxID=9983 RepID=UPI002B47ED91|nr:receptor-transporting protein 4 [Lepus europaeus]